MNVEKQSRAVINHRTRSHRSVFGKRITSGLSLEAKRIENISCGCELPFRVQQHQIHDAFPCTPRYGGAADVFHADTGQVGSNTCCDPLGDFGGSGVVVPTDRPPFFVRADHSLDLSHGSPEPFGLSRCPKAGIIARGCVGRQRSFSVHPRAAGGPGRGDGRWLRPGLQAARQSGQPWPGPATSHYCADSVFYDPRPDPPDGDPSQEHDEALYRRRWESRVGPDDLHYYVEDGLIRFRYCASYPLYLEASAELAIIGEGAQQAGSPEEPAVSRQLLELVRMTTRLAMDRQELEQALTRPWGRVPASRESTNLVRMAA